LGTRRIRAPGFPIEDLPPIDVVLISHDHYDHLDISTLRKLREKGDALVVAGIGVGAEIETVGFGRIVELDWWESIETGGVEVIFVPAHHNSGRGLFSKNKSLWGGFVLKARSGMVYFAGDTAFGNFFDDLAVRFAEPDLSIFPLGNYEKRWFMKNQHMNPEESVKAHLLLRSKKSMGMHFATFLEHPEQTVDAHEKDLAEALGNAGLASDAFWIPKFGEGRYVDAK
jgi:L-ascorbate metabolism protein UlaG (beta-lactamase superfamily)